MIASRGALKSPYASLSFDYDDTIAFSIFHPVFVSFFFWEKTTYRFVLPADFPTFFFSLHEIYFFFGSVVNPPTEYTQHFVQL